MNPIYVDLNIENIKTLNIFFEKPNSNSTKHLRKFECTRPSQFELHSFLYTTWPCPIHFF